MVEIFRRSLFLSHAEAQRRKGRKEEGDRVCYKDEIRRSHSGDFGERKRSLPNISPF